MILLLGVLATFFMCTTIFFAYIYSELCHEYHHERKRYQEAEDFMSNLRSLETKIMSAQEAKIKYAMDNGFGPKTAEELIDEWN